MRRFLVLIDKLTGDSRRWHENNRKGIEEQLRIAMIIIIIIIFLIINLKSWS